MLGTATKERAWRAQRVLHPRALRSLDDYVTVGGLSGLRRASSLEPADIRQVVLDAGLRGRGGAGFSTGRKWATVADNVGGGPKATMIVNGAEGEPGTFKDRTILQRNPYQVIEGALIAARAVEADRVIIGLKRSFTREVHRVRAALVEMRAAHVLPRGISCSIFEGPDEYLFGEESALIETIEGRGPFPRIVPPYRVGLVGSDPGRPVGAAPSLVNNVETIANVPKIMARGAKWFRSVGTTQSPGTVICTVTGDTRFHGVGEVRMGTPLRRVLRAIGGGPRSRAPVKAVLSGVANPVLLAADLQAPVSHEGMAAVGCGLGAAGFMVFDHRADMVAVAAGVARFLSTESCGQCTPCKTDGALLATVLDRLARSAAVSTDLATLERRVGTVSYGARCYLGAQQEVVLASILQRFRPEFEAHLAGTLAPAPPVLIAELLDLRQGVAVWDERHLRKQPDWTFGATPSGSTPIELRARHHTDQREVPR